MKKTYIAPEATEYKVSAQQMIAESISIDPNDKANKDYEGGGDVKGETSIWDLY